MKKNVAGQIVGATMVSASDGSAFTGTVTVYVTGDGGTQALGSVGSGVCTYEGQSFHSYAPAQGETNYDHVAFTFVGSGAIPATIQIYPSFPQTGDSFARIGAPTGASIAADIQTIDDFLDTEIAAIKAKTDNLPAAPAATGDIPTAPQNADAILARDIGSGSGAGTLDERTVRSALRFIRNKWSTSGATLTVTKEDDSTTAWTATVTTSAGADPIVGNDPT